MENTLWIYAHWNKYSKEIEYQLSTYERGASSGDVLLETREIVIEPLEEKAIKVRLAGALKVQLSELRAEHQTEQNELLETINEILALEFKPATVTADDDIPF